MQHRNANILCITPNTVSKFYSAITVADTRPTSCVCHYGHW